MKTLTLAGRRRTGAGFSEWLIAAAVLTLFAMPAWSQSLAIIELHHRTAAEVMPILQPLVEPGGALTGQDYQLFARVSQTNLAQLRQALASIDRQARQLLVSVKNSSRQELDDEQATVSGRLGTARSSASVHATESSTNRQGDGVATVRVIEGGTASIAAGQTVPVVTGVASGGGRRPFVAGTLGYRDLTSGYLVTPRLAGQRVTLQIEQQTQTPADARGGAQTQTLSTQVSGQLGEWVALGAVNESSESTQSGVLSRRFETRSSGRTLWIKVEVAD